MSEEVSVEVADNFKESWRDIVCHPDGSLNYDQVMKELYDYSKLMERFQNLINIFGYTQGISKLTYADYVYQGALERHIHNCICDSMEEIYDLIKSGDAKEAMRTIEHFYSRSGDD